MVTIRSFEPADQPGVTALLRDMQAHYGVPCPPDDKILRDLGTLPAGVHVLVADAGTIVGFAAVAVVYPGPGLEAGLFLKELFVSAPFRKGGVGRQFMGALARLALERGLQRIDWTADRHDRKLLTFYEGLGARPHPEKVFFRLDRAGLASLAAGG